MQDRTSTRNLQLAAWGVHLFTASGAAFGFLALLAIEASRWEAAFAWMAVTLIIDGLDGALARLVNIRETLPRFAGVNLDLIVDYFTYVIVPALFFYRSELLPNHWKLFSAMLILVASQYHSGNLDQKTTDYYFRGFPAWWNVLAFYLYVFHPPAYLNLVLVIVFGLSTFTPMLLFLHPLRVKEWKMMTVGVITIWTIVNAAILAQMPAPKRGLLIVSLAGLAYLSTVCLVRTAKRAPFVSLRDVIHPAQIAEGKEKIEAES